MMFSYILKSDKGHFGTSTIVLLMLFLFGCGKPTKTKAPLPPDSKSPSSEQSGRQSYSRSADPAALRKFVEICQVNGVEPTGVISALFSEYIKRSNFDGYYELYLNLANSSYAISGDGIFLKLVEDFLTALAKNPQLSATDFDFTKSTNFPEIDRKLRKLGFSINIQR